MESRTQIASQKKASGKYNCAQAVASTYADVMGVTEEMAMNMTAAFGTGMGTMEGTCGSLVGAGVVAGMVEKDRVAGRREMKEMMEKFQHRNGATQCKLLKGIGTGKMLRHCNDCVGRRRRISRRNARQARAEIRS